MSKKVFLGVGHGGSDPGAVANEVKEKDLNLAIAQACAEELERHGVEVKLSRKKDENDPLTDEIKECNAYNPDLAADIHNNVAILFCHHFFRFFHPCIRFVCNKQHGFNFAIHNFSDFIG